MKSYQEIPVKERNFGTSYDDEEQEDNDLALAAIPEELDSSNWERLFHSMSQEQLEIIICLFLGLKPAEIVKVLGYPNIAYFYNMNARLRIFYREQKAEFLSYN